MYWLNVLTITYSIFRPTVKAVFDGNVQGVVVQARKKISLSSLYFSGNVSLIILNCAVTDVSETST